MSRTIFTFLVFSISLLAQVTSIPGATGGGGGATASGYSAAVSAQTTLTVTAATHGQGTSPVAGCFDNSTPALSVSCSYTRNTSGDVVFTWAPAFTGTVNIWVGAGTSGISGGGNLTTVGAIPYVSASGVLNQDATKLFWDSANSRLGVGTASPSHAISIVGTSPVYLQIQGSGSNSYLGMVSGVQTMQSDGAIAFRPNSTESARFAATTGNLLIGGTTDGNYRLDVQKSGSTGTLRVYDQTATTGSTLAVIQAGAGQSGNLTEWRNNAGSYLSKVNSSGEIWTNTLYASVDGTNYKQGFGQLFYDIGSGNTIRFFNTSNVNSGSADLGMYRNNPGVLEINNGTAGTLRDLLLRYLQNTGVTVATLPAAAAGNAGSRAYVTDANATTIGSTVAGGGSNKVMVWSNGTNWKIYAN